MNQVTGEPPQGSIDRFLLSSLFSALLSAIVVLSGVGASIVANEWSKILDGRGSATSWIAIISFALLLVALFVGFLKRQQLVDRNRATVQSRLAAVGERLEASQRNLDDLFEETRSMPPPAFLKGSAFSFEKCYLVSGARESASDIETSIRQTLRVIALLAQQFDQPVDASARFAANVMIYVPKERLGEWKQTLKFAGSPDDQGCLVLCAALSATAEEAPDPLLNEMSLPVPSDIGQAKAKGGDGWLALPGAPMAFAAKTLQHFARSTEVADWVSKFCDFAPSVATSVASYFTAHPEIEGLVSAPLFRLEARETKLSDRVVVGVLNLHWRGARLAHKTQPIETFLDAIAPYLALLSKGIEDLDAKGGIPCLANVPTPPSS